MNAGVCNAVRLVAQIHDELLFEANTKLCDVYKAAGELYILEHICADMHVMSIYAQAMDVL